MPLDDGTGISSRPRAPSLSSSDCATPAVTQQCFGLAWAPVDLQVKVRESQHQHAQHRLHRDIQRMRGGRKDYDALVINERSIHDVFEIIAV